jgi:S1-C subfamily serine protease
MKKATLYSPSPRRAAAAPQTPQSRSAHPPGADAPAAVVAPSPRTMPRAAPGAWRQLGLGLGAVLAGAAALTLALRWPAPRASSPSEIDAAVRASLMTDPLPSPAVSAFETIAPSVVRVVGLGGDETDDTGSEDDPAQRAMAQTLGSGVVIIEDGTILTSLHVVAHARRVRVRFANGHESEAVLVGTQPENDLAVLKALSLPDDLRPATLRSTGGLREGDAVLAVGHPFGLGHSASVGVVSGLQRDFRSPQGDKLLSRLIQFDAAVNPGNSGGPLVTLDGHVVGIVAAILNPTGRTFIGIGFAVPIESAAAAAGMPPF